MKKILVPVNFSDVSANALDYAVEVAKRTKAKLMLLHIYYIPSGATEGLVSLPISSEIEKEYLKNLRAERSKIYEHHGSDLKIQCYCRPGFVIEEINRFAQEQKVDLIVMGIHNAGFLTERIIGSVTTYLLSKTTCSVLAIDKEVKFRSIKRIVLATDSQEIKEEPLKSLKTFVNLSHARLYVLNVVRDPETIPSPAEVANGVKLDHALEGLDHSFSNVQNEDIVEGINHFVQKNKIDMIAMIPHKHSGFASIFRESTTKHTVFHASVPVLALHENRY